MAAKPDAPKRPRTDGLEADITLSFKSTQSMNDQLAAVAQGLKVSKSEAIRLAVVAFITTERGQYRES